MDELIGFTLFAAGTIALGAAWCAPILRWGWTK